MGYLLRFPGLEHGRRQAPLLVPGHGGRARCETLRYGPVRSTGDQGLVDGLMLGVRTDGADPGRSTSMSQSLAINHSDTSGSYQGCTGTVD